MKHSRVAWVDMSSLSAFPLFLFDIKTQGFTVIFYVFPPLCLSSVVGRGQRNPMFVRWVTLAFFSDCD